MDNHAKNPSRPTSGREILSTTLGLAAGGLLIAPAVVAGGVLVQALLPVLGVGAAAAFFAGVRQGPVSGPKPREPQD